MHQNQILQLDESYEDALTIKNMSNYEFEKEKLDALHHGVGPVEGRATLAMKMNQSLSNSDFASTSHGHNYKMHGCNSLRIIDEDDSKLVDALTSSQEFLKSQFLVDQCNSARNEKMKLYLKKINSKEYLDRYQAITGPHEAAEPIPKTAFYSSRSHLGTFMSSRESGPKKLFSNKIKKA